MDSAFEMAALTRGFYDVFEPWDTKDFPTRDISIDGSI